MNPESTVLMTDLKALMNAAPKITASDYFAEMTKTLQKASATMTAASQALAGCPCCAPSRDFTPRHQLPPWHLLSPQLAEDLRGGARAIRRQGWARGTWIQGDGAVCGMGGVMVGIGGSAASPTMFETGPYARRFQTAATALQHWLGIDMPAYNDRVATSAEDVIGELEALAFEIERTLVLDRPRPPRFFYAPPRVTFASYDADSVKPIAVDLVKVLEPA